ncbi:putative integral membrane protein [Acanthocheilonema viteae]
MGEELWPRGRYAGAHESFGGAFVGTLVVLCKYFGVGCTLVILCKYFGVGCTLVVLCKYFGVGCTLVILCKYFGVGCTLVILCKYLSLVVLSWCFVGTLVLGAPS